MQLLPCPECQRVTLLDEEVSMAAILQCPACHNRFQLRQIFESTVDKWQVIDDPGESATELAKEGFSEEGGRELDSSGAAGLAQANMEPEEDHLPTDDGGELQLQQAGAEPHSHDEKPKVDWSKFEPITHEQFERARKRSRSPLWSMLQVVLGGVAAVPISMLLIWHLIGTDVGGAGPWVGQHAPWLVPERFRPLDDGHRSGSLAEHSPPVRGASGFRNFDGVLPPEDLPDGGQAATDRDVEPSHDGQPGTIRQRTSHEPVGEGSDSEIKIQNAAELSNELEASRLEGDRSDAVGVLEGLPDPSESPEWTPPQNLFEQIRACESSLRDWREAIDSDSKELRPLARGLYEQLADIAQTLSTVDGAHPVLRIVRDQMRSIGRQVNRHDDVQRLVEQGVGYWLKQHAIPGTGIAAIIEVQSLQNDALHWTIVPDAEQLSPGAEWRVLIPRALAPALSEGQRLFVLGTLRPADEEARSEDDESPEGVERIELDVRYLYGL